MRKIIKLFLLVQVLFFSNNVHCNIFHGIAYTGKIIKYIATGGGIFYGIRAYQKMVESADFATTPLKPEMNSSYFLKLPIRLIKSPFSFCSGVNNGIISVNLLLFALILHKIGI